MSYAPILPIVRLHLKKKKKKKKKKRLAGETKSAEGFTWNPSVPLLCLLRHLHVKDIELSTEGFTWNPAVSLLTFTCFP